MSPDDIFAAQFWPWPDPAIKRDNQGRVLFINAAFLQLYGGTVQDWTGNVVGGWPAPQGPGHPYRFETRMPATHALSEQVYDWMEMTLADGHAFALARNVTSLVQPPEPQPGAAMPEQFAPNTSAMADQSPMMQNMAQNQMAETYAASSDDAAAQFEAPQTQPDYPDYIEQNAPAADIQNPVLNPDVSSNEAAAAHMDMVPETASPITAPLAETAPQLETQPAHVEAPNMPSDITSDIPDDMDRPQERAYERRALPIEDDSAVLGNNWRDAVIAKAVGADAMPNKADSAPDEPVATETVDTSEGPKRILLAEDNAINALLTRTLLEAEGHIVETVQDGQLAVEAMKTSTYDLIFMDMRMPNMDGLEATRKIRTLANVRKDLPIIALTANAFDDDRNACFDSGMNDFMTKPVSAEELSEMVEQWTKPRVDRMAS